MPYRLPVVTFVLLVILSGTECLLFPRESESRELKDISGLWNFRADNSSDRNAGFRNQWWQKPLRQTGNVIQMPVPSSYNDVTQERKLRDFVGWAWYDRNVFLPSSWKDSQKLRVVLRFESCHYNCIVWVNGEEIMRHSGGHLPFESEISDSVDYGMNNRITVAVNNTLTPTTLPPGVINYMNDTDKYPPGYFVQDYQFDFFNYAGIHRPVRLYTTPTAFLSSITVDTDFKDTLGLVKIEATIAAMEGVDESDLYVEYSLYDADDSKVATARGQSLFKVMLNISDVNLWWPFGMNPSPGYLYTLKVTTTCKTGTEDVYRLPIGIRTVDIKDNKFLINDQQFYFRGFGRHEDADIRGKGLDLPLLVKDFNLMKWMGGNSFRTSHYPYAEEDLNMADREGFVVIDESPGVGIEEHNMGEESLRHHLEVMKELVHRDKNHPSVVMWSVANEPKSDLQIAEAYFRSVIKYTRQLDPNRPVTFVTNQRPDNDRVVKYTDILCVNRYYGWYHDPGHIEIIQRQFETQLTKWYEAFKKPIIQAEYGADSIAGMHVEPSTMFSEEYHVDTIKQYFPVFDKYREKFLVGEMIWNLADFATKQETTRVCGNKKGIFTRQRQPKMAAHVLRERYLNLMNQDTKGTDENILRDLIQD